VRNVLAILSVVPLALAIVGCSTMKKGATFGDDVEFLKKHTKVVVLSDASGSAKLAIVPGYQGRVMTSTAGGEQGTSFGWINRDLIASGKTLAHINSWGGEDRFWMGPEGGQFAIFFKKGDAFDFDHWNTPAVIDTEAYDLVSNSADSATFTKTTRLANWTGTEFDVQIDRTVRLLSSDNAAKLLGVALPASVKSVVYESDNKITNKGKDAWTKEKGLLSIWILGIYNPSPKTTVVIPFNAGSDDQLGPRVNDMYFGKVPAERLVVKDNVLFFKADGQCRGKIGLSPKRAKPILGSYDPINKVLTLVQYTKPAGATDYVNSMWEKQKEPFAGDAANSYNDGPIPGQKQMGPFYEIESSSPAMALKPGESGSHVHRTFHIQGSEKDLNEISKATLGVRLEEIEDAFAKTPHLFR
jgi:hypothetical protein